MLQELDKTDSGTGKAIKGTWHSADLHLGLCSLVLVCIYGLGCLQADDRDAASTQPIKGVNLTGQEQVVYTELTLCGRWIFTELNGIACLHRAWLLFEVDSLN